MKFSDRDPSHDWAALRYKGATIAEVWFKPQGEPFSLVFRVPQDLQTSDISRRLTIEALLRTVGISNEEVESWRIGDVSHSSMDGTNPELRQPLPPPAPGTTHITVDVRLNPPAQVTARNEGSEQEVPLDKWQDLETRWKAILGVEAIIEALRQNVESLRAELESASRRSLTVEEKVNALQGDVVQWTKAKNRVHHTLPKMREFIHRATWAMAVPERKRLEELVKEHIEPRVPFPEVDHVREQMEHLLKDRQVLSAQGNAINQEGRAISSELQRSLGTLQRNAADRARAKRGGRGKH